MHRIITVPRDHELELWPSQVQSSDDVLREIEAELEQLKPVQSDTDPR